MAKALKIPLEQLLLDPNNYRIKNDSLYRETLPTEFAKTDVQLRTLNIVCGEKNAGIQDLLGSFTAFVAKLAKEFSVQVFATTHSKECIDGFVDACRAGVQDDFAFIGLVNTPDNVRSARVFSGRQYVEACDLADVDLRGVV